MQRLLDARRFVQVAVVASMLLLAHAAHAAPTPVVEVLNANPSYINNDGTVTLSWIAGAAYGDDLLFACPAGVTVKLSGSPFPCNVRFEYSANASDSGTFTITNVSGAPQNVTVTAYPKDVNNNDYDAGAMSTFFIVKQSAQPITGLSLSATSTTSNTPETISWTSVDTPGVNMQFDCGSNVRVASTSAGMLTQLPCGTAAFSPDLPPSGSATVIFQDTSGQAGSIVVHILPVITAGSYDLTHALSATLTVNPASSGPSVTSFSSASSSIVAGVPIPLSWSTSGAAGANIQLACGNPSVALEIVYGTTTIPISCNTTAFTPALATSGATTSLAIVAQGTMGTSAQLQLLPEGFDGSYYASAARSLTLPIVSANAPAALTAATPFVAQSVATSSSISAVAPTHRHYTFTLSLHLGSKNADVSALQSFLALDPSVYPTGLVTGYFGPATLQALEKFQVKYGIAKPGSAGYGSVGPKTRAQLNALQ